MSGGSNEIPETEAEKAQAEVATKRWADYQQVFKPYEDKFMGEVDSMNSDAQINKAEQLAVSPLARQFAQEGMKIRKGMQSQGVNPNSGLAMSTNSALSTAQADAEIDAGSRGVAAQQDRYVSGLQGVTAMGQGQAGTAIQGMTNIAQTAQGNAVSQAQRSALGRNSIKSAVGLAVGSGLSYGLNQNED